jgi:hypothetical protein
VVALAIGPAAIVASKRIPRVTLIEAVGAIAVSGLLALLALLLARRGRLYRERTLGRAGGERLVRVGRALGLLGTCIAASACIALAFYAALRVFLS